MTDRAQHYRELECRFQRISHLEHASSMLEWDQLTFMPSGGHAARSGALATLREMAHDLGSAPDLGELIESARAGDLGHWETRNVDAMHRRWRKARAVPGEIIAAHSRAVSSCESAWRRAREENDCSAVLGKLGTVVDLTREKASAIAGELGCTPYDALLDDFEPGLTRSIIDPIFDRLRDALPPLVDAAIAGQPEPAIAGGTFPPERQESLAREVMEHLGFDCSRGRLDTSEHPFTGGVPDDTRITTRYLDDWVAGLYATIHETGHALFQQNLPAEYRGQPVGEASGVAMHESQSLLFERQIGRGDAFLEFAAPIVQRNLLGCATNAVEWRPENLARRVRNVRRGFIRIEADELTYPLHVIFRYELETALMDGTLEAGDLPQAWNEKLSEYLGLSTAGDHRMGCLQDIHFFLGLIGYFPTYTLGSVMAAQLHRAARRSIPSLDDAIRQGDFGVLVGWLRKHVHSLGQSESSMSIIARATGSELDAEALVEHLRLRYGSW